MHGRAAYFHQAERGLREEVGELLLAHCGERAIGQGSVRDFTRTPEVPVEEKRAIRRIDPDGECAIAGEDILVDVRLRPRGIAFFDRGDHVIPAGEIVRERLERFTPALAEAVKRFHPIALPLLRNLPEALRLVPFDREKTADEDRDEYEQQQDDLRADVHLELSPQPGANPAGVSLLRRQI
jgi:hypothetical protein